MIHSKLQEPTFNLRESRRQIQTDRQTGRPTGGEFHLRKTV